MASAGKITVRVDVERITTPLVVAALDAIDPSGDPEHAHAEADRVLLAGLSPEVRAAYDRLVARAAWWAFS
jgi:hypothetical protein